MRAYCSKERGMAMPWGGGHGEGVATLRVLERVMQRLMFFGSILEQAAASTRDDSAVAM